MLAASLRPTSLLLALLATNPAVAQQAPLADAHQHLLSPAIAQLLGVPEAAAKGPLAGDLVAMLDSAGIRRAVLLSVAYMFGSPTRAVPDEYAQVRAENNWTAAQAALYPDRLIALCSFNPLKSYALEELERCAADPGLHHGIKLHFGNSDIQLDQPDQLEQLQRVFRAANDHGMAIVVHLRASISKQRPYGPTEARIFLDQLLPYAPDVPVQVAHMAGAGPGYNDRAADSVMAVLAEAVAARHPAVAHLWFDVASLADRTISPPEARLLVTRIRQVGADRILYGSDAAFGDNLRPREGWQAFCRLPLTAREIATIARNLPPYFH